MESLHLLMLFLDTECGCFFTIVVLMMMCYNRDEVFCNALFSVKYMQAVTFISSVFGRVKEFLRC